MPATPNRLILAWDVEGNTLKNKRVYLDQGNGTADGIACDADGNLWCGWGKRKRRTWDGGVDLHNPQGGAYRHH
ncbi:SMP-30/gluconolactonase/LRE family protein [Klebsiella pneumoniae]|nr:SMP-30/gluconolactonase/LRE family protein [Klebsiella pneumoniae]